MCIWEEFESHTPHGALRDPGMEALRASGFADYRDEDGNIPEWFPVILELEVSAKNFANGFWRDGAPAPAGWNSWLRVPGLYRHPPAKLEALRFCTATVKKTFFERLRLPTLLRRTVRRFELCVPLNRDTDTIGIPIPTLAKRIPPDAVVTGVIDDGLAFAHEAFRLPDGTTRVENFWDQDDPTGPTPTLGYGRERRKRTFMGNRGIDWHMAQATSTGLVDEDQVYARIGGLDYARSGHKALGRRVAHGTHVMHAACKVDPPDDPTARPIICVQLPSRAVADTSGASLARHILDGVIYILARADLVALMRSTDTLPVVINVSFGNIAGPHDGSSILEAVLDEIIRLRRLPPLPAPLAIVLPAGNAHLSRCHARFALSSVGAIRSLAWRIQPDDATPSSMRIYARRKKPRAGDIAPRIALRVTPPAGAPSPWVELGETYALMSGPDVLCVVTNLSAVSTGDISVANVWLAPTVTHHPSRNVAAPGLWRVEVRRRSAGRRFDVWAWIQRDDQAFGYPIRGRQSRFEDPLYVRHDPVSGHDVEEDLDPSSMKRGGLMNAFATGRRTVAVGGYRGSDFRAWKHSAGGPLPTTRRRGPEALAISEDSVAHHGRLAAGTRSGSMVAMNGTSVAAPQVANLLVAEAAAGRKIRRPEVRAEAGRQELAPPPRPPRPSDKRGGRGRIARRPLQRVQRFER